MWLPFGRSLGRSQKEFMTEWRKEGHCRGEEVRACLGWAPGRDGVAHLCTSCQDRDCG